MARIQALLQSLLEKSGSDLHLTAGAPPMARVGGDLCPLTDTALSANDTESFLAEILPATAKQSLDRGEEATFSHALEGAGRFRAWVFKERNGLAAVLRHLPESIPTLEQLGFPPILKRACALPRGLVLVAGPKGSGKTTTLAALLDEVNRTRNGHMITIESPIELVHPSKRCLVNQREVGIHSKSFAHAIKDALREGPDFIYLSELPDSETTAAALEAAEAGQLVFAAQRARTAAAALDRVVEQIQRGSQEKAWEQLAASLHCVITQRLVKRADGRGRLAAFEVLVNTPEAAALIRAGKLHELKSLMHTESRAGMSTLNDSLVRLASREVVSPIDAYRASEEKESMLRGLHMANLAINYTEVKGGPPVPQAEKVK